MCEQQLGITLSIIGHNSRDSGLSGVKHCLEWDSSLALTYHTLGIAVFDTEKTNAERTD